VTEGEHPLRIDLGLIEEAGVDQLLQPLLERLILDAGDQAQRRLGYFLADHSGRLQERLRSREAVDSRGEDGLDTPRGEPVEALRREGEDLGIRSDAVRRACVIAEVDRRFARRAPDDLAQDRQATDPGVEDPDGAPIRHRGLRTDRPRPAFDQR